MNLRLLQIMTKTALLITTRLLIEQDAESVRRLRLRGLLAHPEAFGSSYEEESILSDAEFIAKFKNSSIFGAFHKEELKGCAGLVIQNLQKTKHKGTIFGMYVEQKGHGIGNQLLKHIINYAKSFVTHLHLTVVTTNGLAIKLYEKNGFKIYGTELKALRIDNDFHDEYLMALEL